MKFYEGRQISQWFEHECASVDISVGDDVTIIVDGSPLPVTSIKDIFIRDESVEIFTNYIEFTTKKIRLDVFNIVTDRELKPTIDMGKI